MAGPPMPACAGCDLALALTTPVTLLLVEAGLDVLKAAPVATQAVQGVLAALEANGMQLPEHAGFRIGIC